MRPLLRKLVTCGLLCLSLCVFARPAQAQIIWGGEAERGFRPGTYTPFDGAPIMERYNYGTGSFFYLGSSNLNSQRLNYLDYADRVERAYKFGYAVPRDPFSVPSAPPSATRSRVGLGLGFFRAR